MTVETLGISKGRPQKGKLKKAGGQEDQITPLRLEGDPETVQINS